MCVFINLKWICINLKLLQSISLRKYFKISVLWCLNFCQTIKAFREIYKIRKCENLINITELLLTTVIMLYDLGKSWFLSACSFAICSISLFPFATLFIRHCKRFLEIFVFLLLIINCLTWIWSQTLNNVGCWNIRSRFHVSCYLFSRQYIFIKKNLCVRCNIVTRQKRIFLDIIPIIWECNVSKIQSLDVGDGSG